MLYQFRQLLIIKIIYQFRRLLIPPATVYKNILLIPTIFTFLHCYEKNNKCKIEVNRFNYFYKI